MLALDTDHLSVLEHPEQGAAEQLLARLAGRPNEEVVTTIITFEEQMRGWLAFISQARSLGQLTEAYRRLNKSLDVYKRHRVLAFDELAAAEYDRLRRLRPRLGTMDLRIAAVAIVNGATLLSRNLSDFIRIPGLSVEDWTAQ